MAHHKDDDLLHYMKGHYWNGRILTKDPEIRKRIEKRLKAKKEREGRKGETGK